MGFPKNILKVANTLCLLVVLISSTYAGETCQENDDTNDGMRDCLNAQFKTAEQDLDAVYQKLLNSEIDNHQRKVLIKAQSDWMKFRDTQCKLEGSFYEGRTSEDDADNTREPFEEESCTVNLTKARTQQLKELLKRMNE